MWPIFFDDIVLKIIVYNFAHILSREDKFDGLAQDHSNSSANALELLQSCTKPSSQSLCEKGTCRTRRCSLQEGQSIGRVPSSVHGAIVTVTHPRHVSVLGTEDAG